MTSNTENFRAVLTGAAKFLALALMSAAVAVFIYHQVLIGQDPSEAANENSPIELLQLALLLSSSALLAGVAWLRREGREGYALTAAFFLCMAIRESDAIFDHLFYHGAWLPFALAVAGAASIAAIRRRGRALSGLADIVSGKGFGLLCSGMSMVFVFSRILGVKKIWMAIYRDVCCEEKASSLCRAIKNIAEEGSELFGYALIFAWALSFAVAAFLARRRRGSVSR
ncbi:MAG: hypothetical protein IJP66_07870 [Kiritimatiellae bacterium]|nr:hypothetical protein [Kiritimatiellia bacterium]